MRKFLRNLLFILILLLPACRPLQPDNEIQSNPWQIDDLVWLAAADASLPAMDLIASYIRQNDDILEIRFDFLVNDPAQPVDIWLFLDLASGNTSLSETPSFVSKDIWDSAILLTSHGETRVYTSENIPAWEFSPQVSVDNQNETIIFRIDMMDGIPGYPVRSFSGALCNPSDGSLIDQSPVIALAQAPVNFRAPLVLVFWNTMPAVTPAQALRRWDGAHTGPLGRRHGLRYLLAAAEKYNVPIVLADLKSKRSLSALGLLGQTDRIANLQKQGVLILPEVINPNALIPDEIAMMSQEAYQAFDLLPSLTSYNQGCEMEERYSATFTWSSEDNHLLIVNHHRVIPLPQTSLQVKTIDAIQTFSQGFSLEEKKTLLQIAVNDDPADLAILGGNFSETLWGDPQYTEAAMRYIANHPWMMPLTETDLLTFPAMRNESEELSENCHEMSDRMAYFQENPGVNEMVERLSRLPNNNPQVEAWYMLDMLTQPTLSSEHRALRQVYLPVVENLILAAEWASLPYDQMVCNLDTCILSSETIFAIVDRSQGTLQFLASISKTGAYSQWISTSAQLAVGLSDPSDWHLGQGLASDPAVIQGAFRVNAPGTANTEINANRLLIKWTAEGQSQPNSSMTYTLMDDGLQIEIAGFPTAKLKIPVLINPSHRMEPEWVHDYQCWWHETRATCQLYRQGSITVQIVEGGQFLDMVSYQDSFSFLDFPEDPDENYPEGHYLPFPLFLLSMVGESDLTVKITFE